jgi:hypothetical protein
VYATSVADYTYPTGTYWRNSVHAQTPASSPSGPSLNQS